MMTSGRQREMTSGKNMNMKNGPGANCFLGLEWAVEGVKAVVCDEALEVVGAEEVRFETELPEYGTRGGVLVQPNTYALNVPIEMYIRALDLLLAKITALALPQRIRSISGTAPSLLLALTPSPLTLPSPTQPLHSALPPILAHPLTPLPHPLTAPASLPALLAAVLPALPSTTSSITTLPALLLSLLAGTLLPPSETELGAGGGRLWNASKGEWDEQGMREMLRAATGGGEGVSVGEVAKRVREMMPVPRKDGEPIRIASYFCARYGFNADTIVHPFTPPHLAAHLSFAPAPGTATLALGTPDVLLLPLSSPPALASPVTSLLGLRPNLLWEREDQAVIPHPAGEGEGYLAAVVSTYGEESRLQAMGKYTKTWTAFDRLVAVVPPGGSIGLDNKLFCFWGQQGQFRFRWGKVGDFEDSRVVPRCLLESQMLHLRVRLCRLLSPPPSTASSPPIYPASLTFDPYDPSPLPRRLILTGTTAHYPAMAQLTSDVFFASVLVPSSAAGGAALGAYPFPEDLNRVESSRPALGACYLARYVWRKLTRPEDSARYPSYGEESPRLPSYGDETRALLRRKQDSGFSRDREKEREKNREQGRERERGELVAKGVLKKSTFYAHGASRLSSTMLVEPVEEEDETELEEDEEGGNILSNSYQSSVTPVHSPDPSDQSRTRTTTGSSSNSFSSLNSTPSSTLTHSSATTNTTIGTPLLPSSGTFASPTGESPTPTGAGGEQFALPTDPADTLLGLRKLAETDLDAFMGYAAVVPEFMRLERMLSLGFVL